MSQWNYCSKTHMVILALGALHAASCNTEDKGCNAYIPEALLEGKRACIGQSFSKFKEGRNIGRDGFLGDYYENLGYDYFHLIKYEVTFFGRLKSISLHHQQGMLKARVDRVVRMMDSIYPGAIKRSGVFDRQLRERVWQWKVDDSTLIELLATWDRAKEGDNPDSYYRVTMYLGPSEID